MEEQKLLDTLKFDLLESLKHQHTGPVVETTITIALPQILDVAVKAVVDKVGGDPKKITALIVEGMIVRQLKSVSNEALNGPLTKETSQIPNEINDRLGMDKIGNTLNEFARKMETLQGMVGAFQQMANSIQPGGTNGSSSNTGSAPKKISE